MPKALIDIGEFGLIDRIHKLIRKEDTLNQEVTLGIGDDTASFKPRPGYELLLTCDCLVEGRHYLPEHISPKDLGRRAITVNISDIGAMGGKPLYALVSLGLKADYLVADVEEMYLGFLTELKPFGASIIGGNITKTDETNFIDVTLVGEVEQNKLIRRSTAQPGDVILVTGYPGQAAAGLQLLIHAKPEENLQKNNLVRAFNTPTHRALEGQAIAQTKQATAMIDTSDGFVADLGHICQESGVGAVLFQDKLPLSKDLIKAATKLKKDPFDFLLQESDDYELILTCHPDNVDKIHSSIAAVSDVPLSEVGSITDSAGDIQLIQPDSTSRRLPLTGWDHFAK